MTLEEALGAKCFRCGHRNDEHDESCCKGGEDILCRCDCFESEEEPLPELIGAAFEALMFGPHEILAQEEVAGITVSTVLTRDQGYETALLDANGAHPVERYENREAALAGHERWKAESATALHVLKLGYGLEVEPERVVLERTS